MSAKSASDQFIIDVLEPGDLLLIESFYDIDDEIWRGFNVFLMPHPKKCFMILSKRKYSYHKRGTWFPREHTSEYVIFNTNLGLLEIPNMLLRYSKIDKMSVTTRTFGDYTLKKDS